MSRSRSFALAVLAPAFLAAAQGLEPGVGDPVPREAVHALADFRGTPATSFAHYTGRVVLLEFFAHWCVPCAESVPHLNDLEKRFAGRGLSVVGVADDAREETAEWVRRHSVAYAYAHDDDERLRRALGIGGIPYGVLVDVDGTILWRGEPHELADELVERALAGALTTPVWAWDDELAVPRDAVAEGRLGAALSALRQMRADEETEGGVVCEAVGVLERVARGEVQRLEQRLARGDLLGIEEEAPLLAGRWDGAPESTGPIATVRSAADEYPNRARILAGQREVAEVRSSRLRTRSDLTRAIERLRSIEERHPSDHAGVQARELRGALERRLGPQ